MPALPRLLQGSGINVGLLYLGMILKELSERGATLNYRLSVLTEILKPGGWAGGGGQARAWHAVGGSQVAAEMAQGGRGGSGAQQGRLAVHVSSIGPVGQRVRSLQPFWQASWEQQ